MIRLLMLKCSILVVLLSNAKTIIVKNIEELDNANKIAMPGDIILLQNGQWSNVTIKLNCNGTKEAPIVFKAQTAGRVLITGNSKLKLGGQFIIVEGLHFLNGYAGKDNVISFRIDNKQLANNCRVTNTVIYNFNNQKRMEENNWIALYGKHNRIDHCSFIDKKNMGVLMAVMLDDERSRENFHSIDHNHFGRRLPLASNGGEIIRVGLSQHCQFNSYTKIDNNFFEHCDGEAEIISIKSCTNEVKENVFKECQGAVVLRHGDNNLVTANHFLGNDKPGSGGIRIINKGQIVTNNVFYKCRGTDFRAPLVIMNGVPDSPPTRYVQVTDVQITGNIFFECSPLSFCEGSDAERTLPPENVSFTKNSIYNTRDSCIYTAHDEIKGISFSSNEVSKNIVQELPVGFNKTILSNRRPLTSKESETLKNSGAAWFPKVPKTNIKSTVTVDCKNSEELYRQADKKEPMRIRLTGEKYYFPKPVCINSTIEIQSAGKRPIILETSNEILSLFIVSAGATLRMTQSHFAAENVHATNFISSDTSGNADHYSFIFESSSVAGLASKNFFYAYKASIADSIIIRNNSIRNCTSNFFSMNEEKDDKGYYNAEHISISHNNFESIKGTLLNIYRGGSDESTLGPYLNFSHNKIKNCHSSENGPLISLTGVQVSKMFSNYFAACNPTTTLILYKDIVRAAHNLEKNNFENSGRLEKNVFVNETGSKIK